MGAEQGLEGLSVISRSRWLPFSTEGSVPSEFLEVCMSSRLTALSLRNRRLVRKVCEDVSSRPSMIKETSTSPFNSCQNVYVPPGWASIGVLSQKPVQLCSSPTRVLSNPASCCMEVWKRQSSRFLSLTSLSNSNLTLPTPAIQLYSDLPFPFFKLTSVSQLSYLMLRTFLPPILGLIPGAEHSPPCLSMLGFWFLLLGSRSMVLLAVCALHPQASVLPSHH